MQLSLVTDHHITHSTVLEPKLARNVTAYNYSERLEFRVLDVCDPVSVTIKGATSCYFRISWLENLVQARVADGGSGADVKYR